MEWKVENQKKLDNKTTTTVEKVSLHLKIWTIHYPPFIFHDETLNIVYGIEPSVLEILAVKLNFTFEYVFASLDEIWGEISDFGETIVTITGLIGMLHGKEVDIVFGNLYVDYNENKRLWSIIQNEQRMFLYGPCSSFLSQMDCFCMGLFSGLYGSQHFCRILLKP